MSRYSFMGYSIRNCGYHQPDHCVWWEATDSSGSACFHATTLREIEMMILESSLKEKYEREISRLKAALRPVLDCDTESEDVELGEIDELVWAIKNAQRIMKEDS